MHAGAHCAKKMRGIQQFAVKNASHKTDFSEKIPGKAETHLTFGFGKIFDSVNCKLAKGK